jgi:hypothetical protein
MEQLRILDHWHCTNERTVGVEELQHAACGRDSNVNEPKCALPNIEVETVAISMLILSITHAGAEGG